MTLIQVKSLPTASSRPRSGGCSSSACSSTLTRRATTRTSRSVRRMSASRTRSRAGPVSPQGQQCWGCAHARRAMPRLLDQTVICENRAPFPDFNVALDQTSRDMTATHISMFSIVKYMLLPVPPSSLCAFLLSIVLSCKGTPFRQCTVHA